MELKQDADLSEANDSINHSIWLNLFNSVQNILEKLGFEKDQIIKWNKTIDIPFGATTELFVAREAILAGLKFSRFDLYPELTVYIVDDGYIPGSITREAKYSFIRWNDYVKIIITYIKRSQNHLKENIKKRLSYSKVFLNGLIFSKFL